MNTDIVTEARSWLGTRWLHQGRTRDGIDCAGLVILVGQKVCGWSFDITDYDRQAKDETMLSLSREHLEPIPKHSVCPGDVLVMKFENQRHMAVIANYPATGELSIIHAYAPSRKVVEVRYDSIWAARVVGTFRYPEKVSHG